jgi:amino acid transporter
MGVEQEHTFDAEAVQRRPNVDHAESTYHDEKDEEVLRALGYKQEFKRDFSMWTCLGVSFSILGVLPSVSSTLVYSLGYTGPAGSVWIWVAAGIPIQFVALAMGELCSSMPTAGGMYYVSYMLAPEGWGALCSWVRMQSPT